MIGELDHHARFDPDEPLEEFLARISAAWAVCLLSDASARPIQLLCVKNLRASLKRRLGQEAVQEEVGPSRRVDLRAVVRQIAWTRVDSNFEQDLVYLEIARQAFPESYGSVLGFRPAWWIHVDPAAERPRFSRTTEPNGAAGRYFGPIPDRNAAEKLLHALEDLFSLCRDPSALAAAPAGPCQWKQMGKCVGPCDGTVSLPAYRALVDHAASVIGDVSGAIEAHELRMRHAAAALEFEAAASIKAFIDRLGALRQGSLGHLRPLEKFRFIAVMPGRAHNTAKLFTVTPGEVVPCVCLCQKPSGGSLDSVVRLVLGSLAEPAGPIESAAQRERLALATHHLFPARKTPGVLIQQEQLDAESFASAFIEVNRRRRGAEPAPEDEGEVRGLQAP